MQDLPITNANIKTIFLIKKQKNCHREFFLKFLCSKFSYKKLIIIILRKI